MGVRSISLILFFAVYVGLPCAMANEPILARSADFYVGAKDQKF
jgi:hypothetical protein